MGTAVFEATNVLLFVAAFFYLIIVVLLCVVIVLLVQTRGIRKLSRNRYRTTQQAGYQICE